MKKIIFLCIASILCCSCETETQTQYGVVVDVEYHESRIVSHMVPVRVGKMTVLQQRFVRQNEYWRAHVHYNDTICVYENFSHEVFSGDSVSRTVTYYK